MLKRKIRAYIHEHLASKNSKILVIDGARQIGKSYIIRDVATSLFKNYVEINFAEDKNGPRLFEAATTKEELYFRLSTVAGEKLRGTKDDTIIFMDEIQTYTHLLTLLPISSRMTSRRSWSVSITIGVVLDFVIYC